MGGIGKTTLAREVFNNKSLKGNFDGLAWGYVSHQLQRASLWREILLQLIPEDERALVQRVQDWELPGKLYEKLKQNKYLVVLDDVWFDKDLKDLEPGFPLRDT